MQGLQDSKNGSKILQRPNLDYTPDARGLGYVFFTDMLNYTENIAQIDGITGEKEVYGSLLQRCVRTAIKMSHQGIAPGDVVSLCSFNHFSSCVPFIAAQFLGAKIASLDPTLSLQDTAHLLGQVSPKIIFVAPEVAKLIEHAVKQLGIDTEIVVFGKTTQYTPFQNFVKASNDEQYFRPYETQNLKETAIIFFSSGTTGKPKGICINHYGFLMQAANIKSFGICLDVTLMCTSLYWISASMFLTAAIRTGSARIVVPRFDLNVVWNAIHNYKPTLFISAPTQLVEMYTTGRPESVDTSSLKQIGTGGTPLHRDQILNIRKAFPEALVFTAYGLTEASIFTTIFKPSCLEDLKLMQNRPVSSGTIVPGISYKVVDPETEEVLGPNQLGELRLKTEMQMNCYYSQDSTAAWDSQGWLKTGDIVYYDDDHCFYIVDRIKEMLKFQSWHVAPAVLESVLLANPSIAAAIVIGIPHDLDGDHPAAVVVLKHGSKAVTAQEIEKYVEERVDDRKRLRGGVKIVDRIPTSPSGKIKRREIRDMFVRGEL